MPRAETDPWHISSSSSGGGLVSHLKRTQECFHVKCLLLCDPRAQGTWRQPAISQVVLENRVFLGVGGGGWGVEGSSWKCSTNHLISFISLDSQARCYTTMLNPGSKSMLNVWMDSQPDLPPSNVRDHSGSALAGLGSLISLTAAGYIHVNQSRT